MVSTRTLLACASALLLTACLGSPEPYHPGFEDRPVPETLEDAEARAKRLAVPVEIEREDTRLTYSRKEIGRVLGDIPRNPWSTYEWELDDELNNYVKNMGPGFGARPILGRRPVLRPNETRGPEDASAGDAGAGESGGASESGGAGEGGGSDETAEDYGY